MKLSHRDFNGEYTADKTGTQNLDQLIATYPDVPIYAYIFRGAPDFTVSRNPVIIGTSEEKDDESTDGEIAQVEHAYQMNPLSSGHNRSGLPEKVGQLVAAIHQNIVGKTMTSILKGKPVNPPFRVWTVHTYKVSGAILVEVQIDRPSNMGGPSLSVKAKLHGSGQVTKKSLCYSIDSLLFSLQPKREHQR